MISSPYNQNLKRQFLESLEQSIRDRTFISAILMNKRNKESDTKKISIRPIELRSVAMLSFVSRSSTNDTTKNYKLEIGLEKVTELLEESFSQCEFSTIDADYFFTYPEKGKVKLKKRERKVATLIQAYDEQDTVGIRNLNYLIALGIKDREGSVLKGKRDKYLQINKFIEIIDPIISKSELAKNISIVDMGSGKGYLSFALYDHLLHTLDYEPHMTGVELRADLVSTCNDIAVGAGFDNLIFRQGSIETTAIDSPDILIALHACNTATDDAIAKGIQAKSKVIICSPCCHKQIRKQMTPDTEINSISQFGILKDRQAEIVTDTIRALILKAYGYKTNVMQFIATAHTPKNLLITAVRDQEISKPIQRYVDEIAELKRLFGVQEHHLERLTYNR